MTDPNQEFSFEKAYARLEHILEKMNSGRVSLDDAMQLYEEADGLLRKCGDRLSHAEKRIEILLKNRNGDLVLDEQGRPVRQPFPPTTSCMMSGNAR